MSGEGLLVVQIPPDYASMAPREEGVAMALSEVLVRCLKVSRRSVEGLF